MEIGQIFWMLFFPVQEYLDEALGEGAVWGQDYTWDTIIHMEKPQGMDMGAVIRGKSKEKKVVQKRDRKTAARTSKDFVNEEFGLHMD